jgi:cytochrome c biogenesis protein CcmG/thiol:disulfide interchange protein DsbE
MRIGRGVRIVAVLVTALVCSVAVAFALRFGSDPNAVSSPLLGRRVPAVSLRYLTKPGSVSLRRLTDRVTVVNFWASWCIPCRDEHAALVRAAAAYRNDGVRVLGVVYQDDADNVRRFLDEFGGGYDVVTDPGSSAAIDFGLFGVPETFFIDAHHRIIAKVAGPVDDNVLIDTISKILRS